MNKHWQTYAQFGSHVNSIKYTCPRCGTHTCSLPCVKKHKAQAQCSGIRNPAEYRKRTELATPSSIDKDFNFITSVERSITKADSDVLDRGISLAPARSVNVTSKKPKLETEIERREIKLIKAPKGLSRAKQNKTNWNLHYSTITWTVEWIGADGEKVVSSMPETRTLEEGYLLAFGKKKLQKKRKLSQLGQPDENAVDNSLRSEQYASPQENKSEAVALQDKKPTADSGLEGLYFYIHHPLTPSKHKCLIPLLPSQMLKDVVQGRTLLEYPTVYVLYAKPKELEQPYIRLEDYGREHGADIALNLTAHLEDGEVEDTSITNTATGIDSHKVLQVLAQDLGT